MMFQPLILSILIANPQSLLERAEYNITANNWSEAADALDEYVRTAKNPTVEAMYDRGIAHYNLGEYEIAAKAFDEAMSIANDPRLQTYSAFNLGNALYQQTLDSLEGTGTGMPSNDAIIAIEDAKTQIEQVLNNYRTAIKIDTTDMDARANGELAWQMLQSLNQMQKQMEEQQQKQQQDDEQEQEQSEESADQQQENQQQKEEGSSEEEQQKQNDEQSDKNQQDGEQSEQEKQQNQKDGEQSDQEQQQNQEDGEQSEQEKQQNQEDGEQSDQEQQQNQEEQDDEQSNQEEQDGELESIDEKMNEMKASSKNHKDEGERLSEDEAKRLLQLIRDKEQQRRKALAARRAANRIPVEKDW